MRKVTPDNQTELKAIYNEALKTVWGKSQRMIDHCNKTTALKKRVKC